MAHAARVGIIGNLTQRHLEVANKQLDAMLTTEPFETLVTLGGPTMDGLVTQYVRQRGLSLSAAPLPWSERGIDWHNLDLASRRIQKLWVFRGLHGDLCKKVHIFGQFGHTLHQFKTFVAYRL